MLIKKSFLILIILINFLSLKAYAIDHTFKDKETDEIQEKDESRKTLNELLKELREERKIIEEKRLEEIRMKELQKALEFEEGIEEDGNEENNKEKTNIEENNDKDFNVPELIVRLRGKHSLKYLCEYDFLVETDFGNKQLTKKNINDYSSLLDKVSLKVRAGEYINFEFEGEVKEIKVYYAKDGNEINMKRNSILVPDLEERIVLIIEGIYKNGYIKYAVLLDIRK